MIDDGEGALSFGDWYSKTWDFNRVKEEATVFDDLLRWSELGRMAWHSTIRGEIKKLRQSLGSLLVGWTMNEEVIDEVP